MNFRGAFSLRRTYGFGDNAKNPGEKTSTGNRRSGLSDVV